MMKRKLLHDLKDKLEAVEIAYNNLQYVDVNNLNARFNNNHARKRFLQRYEMPLTELEFQMITCGIVLGDYELLAYKYNHIELYRGEFKGVTFYALYVPKLVKIVTFLQENMKPSFLNSIVSKVTQINSEIVQGSYDQKKRSKYFMSNFSRYELIHFDKDFNFSIYNLGAGKYIKFCHAKNLITREYDSLPII